MQKGQNQIDSFYEITDRQDGANPSKITLEETQVDIADDGQISALKTEKYSHSHAKNTLQQVSIDNITNYKIHQERSSHMSQYSSLERTTKE